MPSIFAKDTKSVQARKKPLVTLKWETFITLHCPEAVILENLKEQLLGAGVPFELDTLKGTVTFSKKHEAFIKKAIQAMKKNHQIQIKESDAT